MGSIPHCSLLLFPQAAFPCRRWRGDTIIYSLLHTANITVLTSELFLIIGCAGSLTEEEEYERHEAYVQMVAEYENKAKRCRGLGGSLMSSGS